MNNKKGFIIIILVTLLFINICIFPLSTSKMGTPITLLKKEMSCSLGGFDPQEEWNVTFGGDKYDVFFNSQEVSDGGFIAIGGRNATSWDNGGDCWLVKINKNGDLLWDRTFGGSKTDNGHAILQTSDGKFIILAITESFGAGSADIWLIKTDEYGKEQWNRTYGGFSYDTAGKTIAETVDGGYLIAGSTFSFGAGNRDGWLIKINKDGDEQWNKTYGTDNNEHFWEVDITSDGGYIIIGFVENNTAKRNDAWIVKTDSFGNTQWEKKFGPANQGLSIQQTSDNGYVFLAEVKDTVFGGYLNAWMVKIDQYGIEQWNKLFISPKGEDRFAVHHNIKHTLDGCFIMTGVTNAELPIYSVGDLWLTKMDKNGNILWEKIVGGTGYDTTYTVETTTDNGYIISGMTKSFGSGNGFNAWLIKISDYDNQRPEKPDNPTGNKKGKPSVKYSYLSCCTEPDDENVYYIWDWGDNNYSYWVGPFNSDESAKATHSWVQKGEYSVRVKAKDIFGGESEWSDPLQVSIPKYKAITSNFLLMKVFECFPFLEIVLTCQ